MTPTFRLWLHRTLRWLIGLVFVAASVGVPGTKWGTGKILHPSSFVKSIHTYKMVPEPLVYPMAMYLPWLELSVGLALLSGLWRRESLLLSMGLAGMFLVANLTAIARGIEVDCGCFGSGYHGSAARETILALAMLAVAAVALRIGPPAGLATDAANRLTGSTAQNNPPQDQDR